MVDASPTSLNSISQVIKQKEKELHEIHDLRCNKLESLISQRDQLLLESSKRFERLKDDFQYNLSLIEARDKEIQRLDSCVKAANDQNDILLSKTKSMQQQINKLEAKELERNQKYEADKETNHVRSTQRFVAIKLNFEKLDYFKLH